MLLGKGARSVDTDAKTVTLSDGSSVAYDELIIATGLVPKRIPSFPDLPGIHVLRSFDDSVAGREERVYRQLTLVEQQQTVVRLILHDVHVAPERRTVPAMVLSLHSALVRR